MLLEHLRKYKFTMCIHVFKLGILLGCMVLQACHLFGCNFFAYSWKLPAYSLTVDTFGFVAYNWSFFVYSFSFFTYKWSFFAYSAKSASNKRLKGLEAKKLNCKQRSSNCN